MNIEKLIHDFYHQRVLIPHVIPALIDRKEEFALPLCHSLKALWKEYRINANTIVSYLGEHSSELNDPDHNPPIFIDEIVNRMNAFIAKMDGYSTTSLSAQEFFTDRDANDAICLKNHLADLYRANILRA